MRFIKVEHNRCAEYDKTDYYVVDDKFDHLSREKIEEMVLAIKEQYLSEFEQYQKSKPTDPFTSVTDILSLGDDTTVAQLKAAKEEFRLRSQQIPLPRSFVDRMTDAGFVPVYDHVGIDEVSLHWGHRHGYNLQY